MSSSKVVKSVLGKLKNTGNVVGSYPVAHGTASNRVSKDEELRYARPRVLELKSYNPLLSKSDFVDLVPHTRFSTHAVATSVLDFEVLKVRDPRYFQFRDKYKLVFPNHKTMEDYKRYVTFSRMDGVRPHFTQSNSHSPEVRYELYARNLLAAFDSSESFFHTLRSDRGAGTSELTIETIRQTVEPLQKRSLLIWNFPSDLRPYHIMDRLWLYDIKHCFKLYWDPTTGRTLTFMAFNSENDCSRFCQNYHGVYFHENDDCKLLVEALT
ncbi:LAQU0S03e00276g1_1 [Lachancea quebecensis]|uniref:LAQU0S03e00276g1_1 n=1 Tax=Lachancea quebecensis TaxID=1654605 RepID=A0A0P1KNC0_9SACH|nr:LAQU0S03e00276g1_1 [Lachancea quebecensis]